MTADRWRQLSDALAEVRGLDEPARGCELLRLRGEDADLAAEVESLLVHGEAAVLEGLLEPTDSSDDEPPERLDAVLATGTRIGPYLIDSVLARGGMGTVYIAERLEPYRQRVALKVLDARLTPSMAKRFDTERQLLSQLEHPNIVRLLDGGAADGGLPYLVMEYIDGERIDVYCERLGLTVVERARLFYLVASAVAYVHDHGVLHRDLKPGNVLVSRNGIPKITDFGIARSIREGVSATVTRPGMVPGTPGYMAPEQITGGAGRNLPGVDVYGLGAVLHRLLVGEAPFQSATPLEACLRATTEDPSRVRPRNPAVPRDLETIVLKALARDPVERFAGADEFAEQLRRFLAHEPLTIHPPSLGARVGKWAQRHRVGLLAWGASTLLILGVMTGLLAARNRDLLRTEATLNRLLGHVGLASEDILQDLPPGSDRTHAYFENMAGFYETALEEAASRAGPVLRRRTGLMHFNLARSLGARSDPHAAITHLDRALELLRPLPDAFRGQPAYSWCRFDVFRCLQSRAWEWFALHDYVRAAMDARAALRSIEDLSRDEPENASWLGELGNQHRILAVSLRRLDRLSDAEEHARTAADLVARAGRMDPDNDQHLFKRLWANVVLGDIHEARGRAEEAVAEFRRARESADELVRRRGDDWEARSAAVDTRNSLGSLLHRQGRDDEAEPLLREGLERSNVLLGAFPGTDGYLVRHAQIRVQLAEVQLARGQVRESEESYRKVIAELEDLLRRRPGQPEAQATLALIYDDCPVQGLRDPARASVLRLAGRPPKA